MHNHAEREAYREAYVSICAGDENGLRRTRNRGCRFGHCGYYDEPGLDLHTSYKHQYHKFRDADFAFIYTIPFELEKPTLHNVDAAC